MTDINPRHANIKPAYEQAEGVFKYLGRNISRGPISDRRIIKYDGNMDTIAYAHRDKHPERSFSVPAKTFISRLLSHVPEKAHIPFVATAYFILIVWTN